MNRILFAIALFLFALVSCQRTPIRKLSFKVVDQEGIPLEEATVRFSDGSVCLTNERGECSVFTRGKQTDRDEAFAVYSGRISPSIFIQGSNEGHVYAFSISVEKPRLKQLDILKSKQPVARAPVSTSREQELAPASDQAHDWFSFYFLDAGLPLEGVSIYESLEKPALCTSLPSGRCTIDSAKARQGQLLASKRDYVSVLLSKVASDLQGARLMEVVSMKRGESLDFFRSSQVPEGEIEIEVIENDLSSRTYIASGVWLIAAARSRFSEGLTIHCKGRNEASFLCIRGDDDGLHNQVVIKSVDRIDVSKQTVASEEI